MTTFLNHCNPKTLKRLGEKKNNRSSKYIQMQLREFSQAENSSGPMDSYSIFTLFSHALKQLNTQHKYQVSGKSNVLNHFVSTQTHLLEYCTFRTRGMNFNLTLTWKSALHIVQSIYIKTPLLSLGRQCYRGLRQN